MPVSPMPESPFTPIELRVLAALDFGFTPLAQLVDVLPFEAEAIALALVKLQRVRAALVLDLPGTGRVASRR